MVIFQKNGEAVGYAQTLEDVLRIPQGAATVACDFTTNAALLADFRANGTSHYQIVAGALKKDGNAVTIAADEDRTALFRVVTGLTEQQKQGLRNGVRGFIEAMGSGGTPTQQQRDRALAWALLKLLTGD